MGWAMPLHMLLDALLALLATCEHHAITWRALEHAVVLCVRPWLSSEIPVFFCVAVVASLVRAQMLGLACIAFERAEALFAAETKRAWRAPAPSPSTTATATTMAMGASEGRQSGWATHDGVRLLRFARWQDAALRYQQQLARAWRDLLMLLLTRQRSEPYANEEDDADDVHAQHCTGRLPRLAPLASDRCRKRRAPSALGAERTASSALPQPAPHDEVAGAAPDACLITPAWAPPSERVLRAVCEMALALAKCQHWGLVGLGSLMHMPYDGTATARGGREAAAASMDDMSMPLPCCASYCCAPAPDDAQTQQGHDDTRGGTDAGCRRGGDTHYYRGQHFTYAMVSLANPESWALWLLLALSAPALDTTARAAWSCALIELAAQATCTAQSVLRMRALLAHSPRACIGESIAGAFRRFLARPRRADVFTRALVARHAARLVVALGAAAGALAAVTLAGGPCLFYAYTVALSVFPAVATCCCASSLDVLLFRPLLLRWLASPPHAILA